MAHWLFKSEPDSWSWEDQQRAGPGGQEWDGVRNFQARNHMRAMLVGERGFFYHSGDEKAVVGIVEVAAPAHPDSTADDPRWECVDIKAVAELPRPVTLAEVKANHRLGTMVLGQNARLSVQPVTDAEFSEICRMAGYDQD